MKTNSFLRHRSLAVAILNSNYNNILGDAGVTTATTIHGADSKQE